MQVKHAKLYRVRKIYDLKENRPTKPGSHEASRMCGQAAFVFVPTEEFMRMRKLAKTDKKAFNQWASEAEWSAVWQKQMTFDPMVGQPIYFSSVKMDAGWYRTSEVQKVEKMNETTFHVTTVGSILEVIEDD